MSLLLAALFCAAALTAAPRKTASAKPAPRKTAVKKSPSKKTAHRKATVSKDPSLDLPPLGPYLLSTVNLADVPPPPVPGTCLSCVVPVINTAYSLIGTKYLRGGYSPQRGFDCSGFVRWVFEQNQVTGLPPSAPQQFNAGVPLYQTELLPGDLVFFRHRRRGWHVGMYVGDNLFIHAPNRRRTVSVSRLDEKYWRTTYIGARRIPLGGTVTAGPELVTAY